MPVQMSEKAYELVRMTDSVAIGQRHTFADIQDLIACAKKYDFYLVYGLQCYNEYIVKELKGTNTKVGGAVGAASSFGEESLEEKIFAAKRWVEVGCDELDMFSNVSAIRSGKYDLVLKEMKAIREIAGDRITKAIIHTPLLSPEEIKIASQICVEAKIDFVKTSNGYYGPTTVEHVKIIKEAIGDKAQIKAAGGVAGLDMIAQLRAEGVTRLGLSYNKTLAYIEELNKQ
ncbi:MAG: deoxyribose-phosphate aldolase [Christensenellaceae bacterium]|nr:deoxyribose-phosphate aldolase [Christensenellaceae bacterium]